MNFKQIISDSWYFFTSNLSFIVALCVPLIMIESLLANASMHLFVPEGNEAEGQLGGLLGFWLVKVALYPVYAAALVLFMHEKSTNPETTRKPSDYQLKALLLWPGYVLVTLISTAMIAFGIMLFILPGIWIAVRIAFAEYIFIVERKQPIEAIQSSFITTEKWFWLILAILLTIQTFILMLSMLFQQWISSAGGPYSLEVITHIVLSFLALFLNVAMFRIYQLTKIPV